MDKEQALIQAFIRKPTTYTISVRNGSMLPNKIKKEISFTVKPPTAYVLGLCADVLGEVSDEVFLDKELDLKQVMKYQTQIAQVLSVLSYEKPDFPEWYVEFICKNVELVELQGIIQETAVKCNPSFFLNSFQIAKEQNPMMMMKRN
ncbi:hypothetical protein [Flavicella sp.]|uniref:hypothetical protein n=1 Tax=Flavicella sp. TaxID=2957742 RepID=UPI00301A0553